ncbi:hypothetical protein E3Q18_02517 [Wallemia mellicola]|nr:hypothetical protein E3Q18_02517 [Wallemia mellicola]
MSAENSTASNQDVSLTMEHTRPRQFKCSWRTLLQFPRRLLAPAAIPSAPKFKVRSCTATPLDSVTLESILNDSYLPPLTLVDFQDYLVFRENSVENLFYLRWLTHYTSLHNRLVIEKTQEESSKVINEMSQQYQRCLSTFILPGSAYELNIASKLIQEMLAIAPQQYVTLDDLNGTQSDRHAVLPPSPDAAAIVATKHHVVGMLRNSARKFATKAPANGGRKRGWFALFVGLLFILLGLLIVLVARLYQKGSGGRHTAGAAIPFFWFGVATFVMGLHGICIVVFMFGDARQLHPFEMDMPKDDSPVGTSHRTGSDTLGVGADVYGLTVTKTSSRDTSSDEAGTSHTSHTQLGNLEKGDISLVGGRMQRKFQEVPPQTSSRPLIDTPFVPDIPGHLKRFGTVTRQSTPRSAGVRGIFEPLTSVDEPIVSRVQLQVFYLAAVWGTILAVIGGVLAIKL